MRIFHSLAILIFILIHIFGEFYLNSEAYHLKERTIKQTCKSFIIYTLNASGVIYLLMRKEQILAIGIVVGSHLLVTLVGVVWRTAANKFEDRNFGQILKSYSQKGYLYLIEQGLHIVLLVVVTEILLPQLKVSRYFRIEEGDLFKLFAYSKDVLILCLIFRPVNITFQKLLSHTKPAPIENIGEADVKMGKLIGNLERLLVYLLLIANQYAAIGFVFAAKSITRYERISKDRAFAEYYLLGTLYSMISVLIIIRAVSYITMAVNFGF